MASSKSVIKRLRQSQERNLRNRAARSFLKTSIKKVRTAIQDNQKETAIQAFSKTVPVMDKAVAKRIIHKNTAARYKSRLARQIKSLETPPPARGGPDTIES